MENKAETRMNSESSKVDSLIVEIDNLNETLKRIMLRLDKLEQDQMKINSTEA